MIDCGLYQGAHGLEQDNVAPFGFDASTVDHVLLTHAHLDHCGRLPLLVKRGFRGEIIATPATQELARLVLLDAAHVQEDEAAYQARRAARDGSPLRPGPLYTTPEALRTLDCFGRAASYGTAFDVVPGVRATFFDAGHILGSATIYLELTEGTHRRSVVFSGDLGSSGRPLLRDPVAPPHADALVMESTYGDRRHKSLEASVEELYQAIGDTFRRGGNAIIPTFALERAQELLFHLRAGIEAGRLPHSTPVYLDSPMAISATEIFRRHPECYDAATAALFEQGRDPFSLPGLHFTRDTAESKALNRLAGGAVIMAGSGMATGGRVRHHLKQNLWRENSSVIFVGFAARGTLARQIIDGARAVHLFGEEIPVRAHVFTINGFSAHADQAELLAWQRQVNAPRTFLVHGEEEPMEKFAARLGETVTVMPSLGDSFEL